MLVDTVHPPFKRLPPTTSQDRERPHPTTDGGAITGSKNDSRHPVDLHAWQILRPLLDDGPYLPWSTGALRPSGLVAVCNDIVHRRRAGVVECGSGMSTVVLARLLRQRADGGSLVALEHDAGWAGLVADQLRRESLASFAEVVHAPLAGDPVWYDRTALSRTPAAVDLLVVDGPPAWADGQGLRREPALAAFTPRLTADATVVLDDVDRPGEQEVLTRWQRDLPWIFTVDDDAGIAVGTRRADGPTTPFA